MSEYEVLCKTRLHTGEQMKLNLFAIVLFGFLSAQAQTFTWKGIFIAGDDSIDNFDNSRVDLTNLMSRLTKMDSLQFTSSRDRVSNSVMPATVKNIAAVMNATPVGSNEGCFIHMTSHGAKHQGFYLSLSGILSPDSFAQLVNKRCGNAPTIVLISACYSGQFLTESLKGPNRIIMTAAIESRPSFGCSADTRYTYWDACLLSEIPQSRTWLELSKKVQACIQARETAEGFPGSFPQAFFGTNTLNWTVRQ
jgi:hypothetical protein